MARNKDDDNQMALAVLDTISNMYSTFANKELANAQLIAKQDEQKINNAHLLRTHEAKKNITYQENELLQTYQDNKRQLTNLQKDAQKLNLDIGTDFSDLEPEHVTAEGQQYFKDLGVEYLEDFNVRYNQGKNMEETLNNMNNAIGEQNNYISSIKNRLGVLHDDINFITDGLLAAEGYPKGTPVEYIPEFEKIIDSSDMQRFMNKYSEYDPISNPNGFNLSEIENGVPKYMPDSFLTREGDTINKKDLVNAIASNDAVSQKEILNYWNNSTARQELENDNILFDSTPSPTNQIAKNRLEIWEKDIFNRGGEILPKSLFQRETALNNQIISERASVRKKEHTYKTKQITEPWEKKDVNRAALDRIEASKNNIEVKLGTSEFNNLPIVKDFGKSLKFIKEIPKPNNMLQNKVAIRSSITDALKAYKDNSFRNINLKDELVGSGLEGKFTNMGQLVDLVTSAGTSHEQNAYMKIFSDIVLAGTGQKSAAGKIWREGFLDQLDFDNRPFSGGDLKNVDILASWINHYNVLDDSFQGYDDGVNNFLAELGYTYPKNLGQGRRMFNLTSSTGNKKSFLGYDLGVGFDNGVIELTAQDKSFFTNQNINDFYLDEEEQSDGSLKYKIKQNLIEVIKGSWSNPEK
tara:strand:- start:7565 stop:9475 length:1911 start_codon:yes stop_codon:yes gene_type:complete